MGMALGKYEKLAKGTKANLTTLNLPTMSVQTALGCCEEIKQRVATAGGETEEGTEEGQSTVNVVVEVELAFDLVTVIRDACDFVLGKYAKLEDTQVELLTGTSETEETMNEVKMLKGLFADQLELAGGSRG